MLGKLDVARERRRKRGRDYVHAKPVGDSFLRTLLFPLAGKLGHPVPTWLREPPAKGFAGGRCKPSCPNLTPDPCQGKIHVQVRPGACGDHNEDQAAWRNQKQALPSEGVRVELGSDAERQTKLREEAGCSPRLCSCKGGDAHRGQTKVNTTSQCPSTRGRVVLQLVSN